MCVYPKGRIVFTQEFIETISMRSKNDISNNSKKDLFVFLGLGIKHTADHKKKGRFTLSPLAFYIFSGAGMPIKDKPCFKVFPTALESANLA